MLLIINRTSRLTNQNADKGTGFNQVTRMKIEAFVTHFGFSDNFKQVLEKSTIEKALLVQ